ncbi:MAG: DNA-binding response OmpR family regulator [Enterobacterales bacterium]|jgi:DNA-binding response OmpR family regulator
MSIRILIVEDEAAIAMGLKDDLDLEGYDTEIIANGLDAISHAISQPIDLIILDIMLPGKNGYDVCRAVRLQKPLLPILMLTAKCQEAEKVLGLEMGADDYVTKPFSPLELRARVKALLRRSQHEEDTAYSFSSLTVNLQRMEVLDGNKTIELTALEFKLLTALIKNNGHVLSRDRILDLVWGPQVVVTDRVIDTHIANLRKKIEPKGAEHITSIRGMGYRFDY